LRVADSLDSVYIPSDEGMLNHARLAAVVNESKNYLLDFEGATVSQLGG
jgi:hypothetical protein